MLGHQHLIQGLSENAKKYSPLSSKFVISTSPLKVYSIERSFSKPDQPVLYYLRDGPKRGFVREELLVVPPNTQLPPEQL